MQLPMYNSRTTNKYSNVYFILPTNNINIFLPYLMVESRLGWFKHVSREPIEASVRRVDQMEDIPIGKWCH